MSNSFICTQGKHQNYPCPYRNDYSKCPSCITVTEQMEKDYRENGYVCVPVKNGGNEA